MTDKQQIIVSSKAPLLRQPTIVDEIIKQQINQLKQHTPNFIWFICVPNIKVPTAMQQMEIRFGKEIAEARIKQLEEVKKFKEAVLIDLNKK